MSTDSPPATDPRDPGTRSVGRRIAAVGSAALVVVLIGGVAIAASRSGGGSSGRDQSGRFDRVTTSAPQGDDDSRDEPDASLAFADGSWSFTLSTAYRQTGTVQEVSTDSAGELVGGGTLQSTDGHVSGTFSVSGPGWGTVGMPSGGPCSSAGVYTLTGNVDGSASGPSMTWSMAFSGSVSCPEYSGPSDIQIPGTASSQIVVLSASPQTVVADWTVGIPTLGFTVDLRSRLVATREGCPRSSTLLPRTFDRIRNGTDAQPTRVRLDVDPSIRGVPALFARLTDAMNQWNANLGAAGLRVEFTTDPAATGPVVHVGIDGPAIRGTLPPTADSSGEPMDRPVTSTAWTQTYRWTDGKGQAWTADQELPDGPTYYTQEATVRLNETGLAAKHGPKPGETWATLAETDPNIVERVFLHELGHVLGLDDQSTQKDSPMYKDEGSLRDYSPTNIGCADLATLRSLAGS